MIFRNRELIDGQRRRCPFFRFTSKSLSVIIRDTWQDIYERARRRHDDGKGEATQELFGDDFFL